MKVGKPKSKRVSVRLRHKIEKASASKQRKQRKEAKKNPQWTSRLKKDPGIPNLFPYKAKLLAEIEDGKRRKAEEQMQKRELAKARRQGTATEGATTIFQADEVESDLEEDGVHIPGAPEQDMEIDEQNPMAALLASAQARASTFGEGAHEDDDDDEDEEDDWDGIDESTTNVQQQTKQLLPKQAREDPVKAIALLIEQARTNTPTNVQTMIDYYQLPPLVLSATDLPARFLVEVARKRGRLGRGGIPNLHSAALVVLNDINDERLQLTQQAKPAGEVTIVKSRAAPFKIEGLWGDRIPDAMSVDTS